MGDNMLVYMDKRNVPRLRGEGGGRVWASIAARMAQAGRRAPYHARVYEGPPSYNTESPGTNEGHTDGGGGPRQKKGGGIYLLSSQFLCILTSKSPLKLSLVVTSHKIS